MFYIFSAIFFGFFMIFAVPSFFGIFNAGNIAGMLVTAFFTAVCLFPAKFREIILSLQKHTFGKAVLIFSGSIFFVCLITAFLISFFMLKEINDKPQGNSTMVVLGCQVRESGASLMLRRRLDTAAEYLSVHTDMKVIVSGGQGADEPVSEAQCMYEYLVAGGISPNRIFIEDKSANTAENIEFSKNIIRQNGLPDDITIVTDGYHQLRADIFAERNNLRAYNISAPTSWYLLPTYWVREWFGIIYYTFF